MIKYLTKKRNVNNKSHKTKTSKLNSKTKITNNNKIKKTIKHKKENRKLFQKGGLKCSNTKYKSNYSSTYNSNNNSSANSNFVYNPISKPHDVYNAYNNKSECFKIELLKKLKERAPPNILIHPFDNLIYKFYMDYSTLSLNSKEPTFNETCYKVRDNDIGAITVSRGRESITENSREDIIKWLNTIDEYKDFTEDNFIRMSSSGLNFYEWIHKYYMFLFENETAIDKYNILKHITQQITFIKGKSDCYKPYKHETDKDIVLSALPRDLLQIATSQENDNGRLNEGVLSEPSHFMTLPPLPPPRQQRAREPSPPSPPPRRRQLRQLNLTSLQIKNLPQSRIVISTRGNLINVLHILNFLNWGEYIHTIYANQINVDKDIFGPEINNINTILTMRKDINIFKQAREMNYPFIIYIDDDNEIMPKRKPNENQSVTFSIYKYNENYEIDYVDLNTGDNDISNIPNFFMNNRIRADYTRYCFCINLPYETSSILNKAYYSIIQNLFHYISKIYNNVLTVFDFDNTLTQHHLFKSITSGYPLPKTIPAGLTKEVLQNTFANAIKSKMANNTKKTINKQKKAQKEVIEFYIGKNAEINKIKDLFNIIKPLSSITV